MRFLPLAFLSLFALAACETVEGFGQDVENGGEALQDASNDVQADL
ncbi:MAG: entericidin A/B family lipoprotein [Pseudomonadota bacterium]